MYVGMYVHVPVKKECFPIESLESPQNRRVIDLKSTHLDLNSLIYGMLDGLV